MACPLWWPGCNEAETQQLSSLSLEAAHAAGVPTVVARRTLQAGNNLIGRLVASADEAVEAAVEGAGLIVLRVSLTHIAVQSGRRQVVACTGVMVQHEAAPAAPLFEGRQLPSPKAGAADFCQPLHDL